MRHPTAAAMFAKVHQQVSEQEFALGLTRARGLVRWRGLRWPFFICRITYLSRTCTRGQAGTEEDGSHTRWKKRQAGQCSVKVLYAFLAWYSASVWRLLVLVDVFSCLSKRKQTNKQIRSCFMFEVAICWLCSFFLLDKCHIAQSYSPSRPCKWHFPASSTWDTCKFNYYSRRILISHQILNLQPLRKSKTAEKTPGYLKRATLQFRIIHHQSVNKKSIILFLELTSWPPQKTSNYSISVI